MGYILVIGQYTVIACYSIELDCRWRVREWQLSCRAYISILDHGRGHSLWRSISPPPSMGPISQLKLTLQVPEYGVHLCYIVQRPLETCTTTTLSCGITEHTLAHNYWPGSHHYTEGVKGDHCAGLMDKPERQRSNPASTPKKKKVQNIKK